MIQVFKNAWICQLDDHANVRPVFGDIVFNNGRITEIVARSTDKPSSASGSNEYDAQGRILTIPNVNFHEHIYSRLAKGLPVSGPMSDFEQILKNLWWKLDRNLDYDMIQASAQMAALESLQNGVTYIFDHHASPFAVKGSLKILADVLQEFGLHSVLSFEVSDRNGPDIARESIKENVNFIRNHTNENVKGMMGLHALFTLSDETLKEAAQNLANLNTGVHIHVAEDAADVRINREKFKETIVQRLQAFNLLNDRSLLIHGVHLGPADYEIIRRSGAALVYNADSNLNNAVGLPNYHSVPEDIPILAGTDGMHANVGHSLKQLFLLYRHQGGSFEQTFAWLQKIFKDQLNFVRKYFPDFSSLSVNDRADFILWDYIPPTPFNAHNFWGHFIYGIIETPVYSVVQNGKLLLHERKLLNHNAYSLHQNIARQGARLFKKFKEEK